MSAVHFLHARLDARHSAASAAAISLPSAAAVRFLSLGFQTTAADIYWLRLTQEVGSGPDPHEWHEIYPLIELITDLDPSYGYAYEVGGSLLISQNEYALADAILKKGMEKVPNRWQLPFLRGFLAWYEQKKWADAAPLILQASSIPKSPSYLPELAARLFAQSDDIDTGISMLESLAGLDAAGGLTDRYSTTLRSLQEEKRIRSIEKQIDLFSLNNGRLPTDLDEVLPPTELGWTNGRIEYDPATGVIHPLSQPRLVLTLPAKEIQIQPVRGDN